MVTDARSANKAYLDTYLLAANLTEDDGSTLASYHVCYETSDYDITRILKGTKNVDVVFTIGTPVTTPDMDPFTQKCYGYTEVVPITIFCIDKTGITGTKLRWKAEQELRRIVETYPQGSVRNFEKTRDNEQNLGSTILYSVVYELTYERGIT